MTEPVGVERWSEYRHLSPDDRRPPDAPGVFFDPVDTEVGVWAAVDLVRPGATVLDLGSGSGAAASAVARAGAGHVHGLDVSVESVRWASGHYRLENGSGRVTFDLVDYTSLSSAQLLEATPFGAARPPDVVMSNPPYVPVPPPPPGTTRVSIDGGTDGLRLVGVVVGHAASLRSALGLTIGSYTSVRRAASLLAEFGYEISSITLSALRLGEYTERNSERVLDLERRGEGPLLRTDDGAVQYIVVGLSCRRLADPDDPGRAGCPVSPDALLELLRLACQSPTVALESLDGPGFTFPVPVRVLVLPDVPGRLHC
ncbi:MAG TPA: methyltransferase domain-containing protein [Acidimicrobiales bacterium]|nr:methyltransferase domain-containing protein [Acidimicrobiales bacterium]